MHTSFKFTALSLGLLFAANALAATDLTVVSFGGANKAAQVKAFYAPWESAGNGKIIAGDAVTANDPGLNLLQARTMGTLGLVATRGVAVTGRVAPAITALWLTPMRALSILSSFRAATIR